MASWRRPRARFAAHGVNEWIFQMQPERQIEPDGAPVDVFPLPVDESSLEKLLRNLFAPLR